MNNHDNAADMVAEADRERARADAGEGLARLRGASLDELASLAGELRCQVDDLTDDAHSSNPIPPDRLRNVTARLSRLADTLSRAARGYAGARATDMAYPRVFEDLDEHGWTARPDRDLDGTLPPIPISELGDNHRGYRRGWRRGDQTITLWFTGPYSLAYGAASGHGRLWTVQEVKAVITSAPTPIREANAESRRSSAVSFGATYDQVADHMRAAGWGAPVEEHPCDRRGIRRPDGTGTSGVWESPSVYGFRVYAWGVGDEPAHVWYWAGTLATLDALRRLTDRH
ncbi:hypothetical protein [Saccharopolyspora sp. SCSIO 74807]|uniref:hypothetical protein n=1 Tax=Saccharopolyspora sp. SCSIO 74807 TaxID=3118084 RepID=UPI0030D4E6FA